MQNKYIDKYNAKKLRKEKKQYITLMFGYQPT